MFLTFITKKGYVVPKLDIKGESLLYLWISQRLNLIIYLAKNKEETWAVLLI